MKGFLHESKGLIRAHRGDEVLAQIPSGTVMSILLEVGIFAEESSSYTDSSWWMEDNTQVFGCLWLARHIENYTRYGN